MPAFPETGSNKVQIFTEMHYQPSFRSQEGPRLLPPPDSVPLTGREMVYAGEEFKDLDVPGEFQSSYDPGQAAHLFQVNCAVCHGTAMRGDSMMATKMVEQKVGPVPADLMAELTREATDGELFGFISRGRTPGTGPAGSNRKLGPEVVRVLRGLPEVRLPDDGAVVGQAGVVAYARVLAPAVGRGALVAGDLYPVPAVVSPAV